MGVKAAVFCAIDISPGEMKNVVDTESSVQTDQDERVRKYSLKSCRSCLLRIGCVVLIMASLIE